MNWPNVTRLGPGYTKVVQVGANTIFFGENVQPVIMEQRAYAVSKALRFVTKGDWAAMKAAEDKRRARMARNLGLV